MYKYIKRIYVLCQYYLENLMKTLIAVITLGLSLSAYADQSIPTKTIDAFAITTSSKLVLASNNQSYIAPFTNCSMESIRKMKEPNIFFTRPRVRPDTTVIVYDTENRKHEVRCTIEQVVKHDQNYIASLY